jgi:hypothetical protein
LYLLLLAEDPEMREKEIGEGDEHDGGCDTPEVMKMESLHQGGHGLTGDADIGHLHQPEAKRLQQAVAA